MSKETLDFVTHIPAEKLQNFFGVFLQFHIGVDKAEKALESFNWNLEKAIERLAVKSDPLPLEDREVAFLSARFTLCLAWLGRPNTCEGT